jgi:hypothetical protein
MQGKSGLLLAAGRTAAVLGDWTLDGASNEWTFNAAVRTIDEYWFDSADKFTLAIDVGERVWRWQVGKPELSDGKITLSGAGAPEKR